MPKILTTQIKDLERIPNTLRQAAPHIKNKVSNNHGANTKELSLMLPAMLGIVNPN